MRTPFKQFKMPIPVWNNLCKKKARLEQMYYEIYKKKKNIPMTKVILALSSKDIYINELELKQLPKRRIFRI